MKKMAINFNEPYVTGNELKYIKKVFESSHFQGNGPFTKIAHDLLSSRLGGSDILLTHSCTGALEMASLLLNIKPGDEVIVPSFTFVTSASSFMRSGAKPVFCEINPHSFQIDLEDLKRKISSQTKAVIPVHYAGNSCDMHELVRICKSFDVPVVEDCAQGLGAKYRGEELGSFGDLAAISFHETKNIHCGLGGCLIINNKTMVERAGIIWERGTNRSQFFRGLVDKYTWKELGSSFYPSELQAAFLVAQLENIDENLSRRRALFDRYQEKLKRLQENGLLCVLETPPGCEGNSHMVAVILNSEKDADYVRLRMKDDGIQAVIHYVPLHESDMGAKLGYSESDLSLTSKMSKRLLRLPMHNNMAINDCDLVIESLEKHLKVRKI